MIARWFPRVLLDFLFRAKLSKIIEKSSKNHPKIRKNQEHLPKPWIFIVFGKLSSFFGSKRIIFWWFFDDFLGFCLIFSLKQSLLLPVFSIMALSGPLFTEMNDGEAQRHGAAGVVVAKSPTPLASTFQDRWFKYVWIGCTFTYMIRKWVRLRSAARIP